MLSSLFSRKRPNKKNDMLNEGLQLAMAFGKNWQVSTQERFAKKYPTLSATELDEYNQLFLSALKYAHDTAFVLATNFKAHNNIEKFKEIYCAKYNWVSEENLKPLYKQGLYYVERQLG
ncbi:MULTISPECIES: hypothetical protein [unclassified Oleiphilus]|uniref:hypothetical protein n=2 Tax=Oleiphilus TaxID=141450 RepID=UPI000A84CB73|nr:MULTISPECIES: hypothetical protein [unclassified Oleiphilus]